MGRPGELPCGRRLKCWIYNRADGTKQIHELDKDGNLRQLPFNRRKERKRAQLVSNPSASIPGGQLQAAIPFPQQNELATAFYPEPVQPSFGAWFVPEDSFSNLMDDDAGW
jgi:hypothetical protein